MKLEMTCVLTLDETSSGTAEHSFKGGANARKRQSPQTFLENKDSKIIIIAYLIHKCVKLLLRKSCGGDAKVPPALDGSVISRIGSSWKKDIL